MKGVINLRSLSAGLNFRRRVVGRKQTYYVFQGADFFFICSFSRKKPKAGNFNIVNVEAVRHVWRLVAGKQGVTSQDVHRRSRSPHHIGSALEALNALYVLVATGYAKIDQRHKGNQLFFNIKES